MSKKTIAVMTSYYINNYGSVLQAFATKQFLSSFDLDVIFINYVRENVRNRIVVNPKWNKNPVTRSVYKIYKFIDGKSKDKVFGGFVRGNLKLSEPYMSRKELYDKLIEADIFCVGSDQMWNSEYNGGVIGENYLDFVPDAKKKISFSTSLGMTSYSQAELNEMKRLLSNFSFISVREKDAVEILSSAGISPVYQILDPTLLLTAEQWRRMVYRKTKHTSYVLIYQLNNNPQLQRFAQHIAHEKGLQIIQITYFMSQHWKGIKSIYNPRVDEFISLIDNAEYIVTDSFHGTAFSINLGKEFFSFSPGKYTSRIKSILELTGLEDRFVNDWEHYTFNHKIDYRNVEKQLNECRSEAAKLLEKVL